jgi:hypothetical protein
LDLAVFLARFSPSFALNSAAVRLAGTGVNRHRRFLDVFNLTRDRLEEWYWDELVKSGLSEANPQKYGKYEANLSGIPRLPYRETWPGEDVQAALIDMGVLARGGLIFFAGAYVTMLRYDLR